MFQLDLMHRSWTCLIDRSSLEGLTANTVTLEVPTRKISPKIAGSNVSVCGWCSFQKQITVEQEILASTIFAF